MPQQPVRIDLEKVLLSKTGDSARRIPRFVVNALKKLIHQDELNALLEQNFPKRNSSFCQGILDSLNVRLNIVNPQALPRDSRCIIVSNHPLGGLDGITMIAALAQHYNKEAYFLVNDLLMAIDPLKEIFIPVNKHGAQQRQYADLLDKVLASDNPVVIYPAGLVSRLQKGGVIADLRWHKAAVNKAIASHRDIVPVHFDGRNSKSFYRWARLRKALGIKFNAEMILLPREIFRSRSKTFTLTCGNPIPWQSLKGGTDATAQAQALKELVYNLPHQQK